MSLLLARDDVVLTAPDGLDEHGWRLPDGTEPLPWSGVGNLQLMPGISNPRAAEQGGRGPFGPARDNTGQLYLPADAPVADGVQAQVRGRRYVLAQARLVTDPVDANLTCWSATATSVDTWPS